MAPSNPGIIGRVVNALTGKLGSKDRPENAMKRIARKGMSPRQQELNALWTIYRCSQYLGRKLDWNGKENTDRLTTDVIASQGYITPGFMDMGSKALPLKFRKPTAPYALVRTIVDRFTGILFSEGQHPEIKVDGDPVTEDWLRAVADVTRIWQVLIQARTYGGAMGSVALGFQFAEGKPHIEVHDPRWLNPTFKQHGSAVLVSLEKRYTYPKEELDETTGRWETKEYWYRRVIDEQRDVLYAPVEVDKGGEEPEWVEDNAVAHNFGFCPVVWVQNLPVQDSEDGDPDCTSAVYETVEAIDALLAQANRAIIAACDPTLVITTKAEMAEVRVGTDNALRIPDGDAKFLEAQQSGAKAAQEMAEAFRKNALEMAQCVLEHPDVAGKTATEVERMYQSMLSKADVLREQYGQKAVLPLLEMMWRAAGYLEKPQAIPQPQAPGALGPVGEAQASGGGNPYDAAERLGAPNPYAVSPESAPDAASGTTGVQGSGEENDGMLNPQVATVVRRVVVLPPRYDKNPDGTLMRTERARGQGGTITLKWPKYFQPTLDDVTKAVTAAVGALSGGVIDDATAVPFVAPFFGVEDQHDLLDRVRNNAAQQQADMMSMMGSSIPGEGEGEGGPGGGAPPPIQ